MLHAIPVLLAALAFKYRIPVNAIGVRIEAFATVHCFPGVYELLTLSIFSFLRARATSSSVIPSSPCPPTRIVVRSRMVVLLSQRCHASGLRQPHIMHPDGPPRQFV